MMNESEFWGKYAGHLNNQQREAVLATDGPVLLLAVPGSGKTTVLVTRLGYMLYCRNVAPENILTLTYTIAATQDMARRFASLFGEDISDRLEFRTINGICAKVIQHYGRMIGRNAFELITDEKQTSKILMDVLVKKLDEYPTESDIKVARTLITYCKNMMLSEDEIDKLGKQEGIPLLDVYKDYNAYLKSNALMDYDDQMVYAYKMLMSSPELLQFYKNKYQYICVDEAQDTSKIQHMIIKLLAGENGNLFMVGDEDQSIYGFRAAYPEALLNFEKDHSEAKVLVMDQNYRSNACIVAAADIFIQHNKMRHDKHMQPTRGASDEIRYVNLNNRSNQYNYLFKVASGCTSETAVLYRDNESALPLIDMLERNNIQYRIKSVDMAFFTNRVVTDVTNIMKLALDPCDDEAFMRVYFKCQTFLKKAQAQTLCRVSAEKNIPVLDAIDYELGLNGMVIGKCKSFRTHLANMRKENPARALNRIEKFMGYGEYLERNSIDDNKLYILKMLAYNEVSISSFLARLNTLQELLKNKKPDYNAKFILSTIHSSKGLEYDEVYLMDVCDGVFPAQVIRSMKAATPQEKKEFEEERRLFYVGITRAKDRLNIFKFGDNASCFLKEIILPVKEEPKCESVGTAKLKVNLKSQVAKLKTTPKVEITELVIGEEIIQNKYGHGVITDVVYDDDGDPDKFTVEFDDGTEKTFMFPIAFITGMRKADDSNVSELPQKKTASILKQVPSNISVVKVPTPKVESPKPVVKSVRPRKRTTDKNKYTYWEEAYPDCVVIKKEGAFWTTRGESAKTLAEVSNFRLGGIPDRPVTGSPNLDGIMNVLDRNDIKYIVVENEEIVDHK